MAQRLAGKVAIVTGAGRGIGRSVAIGFAREGARLALCSRTEAQLAETADAIRRIGGTAIEIPADVAREEDIVRLVKMTVECYGTVDILVNNAAILTPRATLAETTTADWDLTMIVNVRGPFLLSREVSRVMIPKRTGSIINLSSGAGKRVAPFWGTYSLSKVGIEGMTKIFAEELRSHGIRVNAVNPGGTRTEMRSKAYPREDPMTLPHPDDLVPVFVYLASDDSAGITGQSLEAREWIAKSGDVGQGT